MKIASLNVGRDGCLVVVSQDLSGALKVPNVAPTLQHAIENRETAEPRPKTASDLLNAGRAEGQFSLCLNRVGAPLAGQVYHDRAPLRRGRCHQWARWRSASIQ
jgi:fumarylacetoacetate (FAA) hydrolase